MKKATVTEIMRAFDTMDAGALVALYNAHQKAVNPYPAEVKENTPENINAYFANLAPARVLASAFCGKYDPADAYYITNPDGNIQTIARGEVLHVLDFATVAGYIIEKGDALGNSIINDMISASLHDDIMEILRDCENNGDILDIYNEFCDMTGYGDMIHDMSDFDYEMNGESPSDIADYVLNGSYNSCDNYFTFDGSSVETFDYLDDRIDCDVLEKIAEYVEKHSNGLGYCRLEELFEVDDEEDDEEDKED